MLTYKFMEKNFGDEDEYDDLKTAYLKACKWVSTHIISKKHKNVVWKMEKYSDSVIRLKLYCELNEDAEFKSHCKMCKEFHTSFFLNDQYNCDVCKLKSFLLKMNGKAKISKEYYREQIKRE